VSRRACRTAHRRGRRRVEADRRIGKAGVTGAIRRGFGLAVQQHAGIAGEALHGALQVLQLLAYRAEAGTVQAQPVVHCGLQFGQCLAAIGQVIGQLPVEAVLGIAAGGVEDVQAGAAIVILATVGARVRMLEIGEAEAPLRRGDDRHRAATAASWSAAS
jgi:hypothetical protein